MNRNQSHSAPSYKTRRRLSLKAGTLLEVLGIAAGFTLLYLAVFAHPALGILLLLASWFCFWYFPHCATHLIVGWVLGIRFRFYFVGRSSLLKLNLRLVSLFLKRFPVLGIKTDAKSFAHVEARRRALMFASGALASMTFPLISLVYAWSHLPTWMSSTIGFLTSANIVLTLYYGSKVGDFWKSRNTLRSP